VDKAEVAQDRSEEHDVSKQKLHHLTKFSFFDPSTELQLRQSAASGHLCLESLLGRSTFLSHAICTDQPPHASFTNHRAAACRQSGEARYLCL
jgi:hypothetical protein